MPRLKTGEHFLDVSMRTRRGVEDWASRYFLVSSAQQLHALRLEQPFCEPGVAVSGEALLAGPPGDATLRFTLTDTLGRVIAQEVVRPTSERVAFSLPTLGAHSRALRLRGTLLDQNGPVDAREQVVFVRDRMPARYPPAIAWCGEYWGIVRHIALQQLKRAGIETDPSVRATHGDAHAVANGVPMLVESRTRTSRGRTLFLNFPFPVDSRFLGSLLADAGVRPTYALRTEQSDDVLLRAFENPNYTILGVARRLSGTAPEVRGAIELPERAHVYDVRRGEYLGHLESVPLRMATAGEVRLFALLRRQVTGLRVDCPDRITAGEQIPVRCVVLSDDRRLAGHVLRLSVTANGEPLPHYTRVLAMNGQSATFTIHGALNDVPGLWKLSVTDVLTGTRATATVEFAEEGPPLESGKYPSSHN